MRSKMSLRHGKLTMSTCQFKHVFYDDQTSDAICTICGSMFANRYIRDFHLNHIHFTKNHAGCYSCYHCEDENGLKNSQTYFQCYYQLLLHKSEAHDENTCSILRYL